MLLSKNGLEITSQFDYELTEIQKRQAEITRLQAEIEDLKKPLFEHCKKTGRGIKSLLTVSFINGSDDTLTIDIKKFAENAPQTYNDIVQKYPKTKKGTSVHIAIR